MLVALATWLVVPAAGAATPTFTPRPPIAYDYDITGTATLKTLTRGVLPLTGSLDAELTLKTGDFVASLTFEPTTASLVALGFIPLRARVVIEAVGPVTGRLTEDGVAANVKVRVKVPSVTMFGLWLGGGPDCGTRDPSLLAFRSPGDFPPLDGGSVASTFSIGPVVRCGPFTGLVAPLTQGSGNVITLGLLPKLRSTPTPAPTATPAP